MNLFLSGKIAMDELGPLIYGNYEDLSSILFQERTSSKSSKLQSMWGTDGLKEKA